MKKIIFLFILSILCSIGAMANDFTVGGLYYNFTSLSQKTVEVTSQGLYSANYYGSITIPDTVTYNGNTYSVTSIGNTAFFGCVGLTGITIPNSITSIGGGAFSNCSSLISITIPNSVTNIASFAFQECSGLISITIPNSVTYIGSFAFQGCSGLTSITIPNSVTSIGGSVFSWCTGLTSIIIPNSVTSIGGSAFQNCSSLISITIPAAVTSIGNSAFFNCSSLNSITCKALIPPSIIGDAFFDINKTIPVYILCGSKSKYQSASYWNEFTNFIEYDSITYYDTICKGQIYNQYGFNFIADTTGVYTQSLQTANGCDSVITLNLTVNPSPITPSLLVERKHSYLEITWDSVGDSYEVYRDDSLIATTSQAIYQDSNVLNDSSYCYKVKAFIGNCESDFSVSECLQFVGLNEININSQDISLYPNPTNGKAKLSIQSLNDKAQVIIFDLTGRALKTYIIDTNQKELEIDLSGFAKGVYNISIKNKNTNISKKLIIQ